MKPISCLIMVCVLRFDCSEGRTLHAANERISTSSVAVNRLVDSLRTSDKKLRAKAAVDLGLLGNRATPAVPALLDLATDEDPCLVAAAINALIDIGPAGRQQLVKAVSSKNDRISWAALEALSSMRHKEKGTLPRILRCSKIDPLSSSRSILRAHLAHRNPILRRQAIHLLFSLRDPCLATQLPLLIRDDPEIDVRLSAITVAGYFPDQAANIIPALLAVIIKNPDLAPPASLALRDLGKDAIPAFKDLLKNKDSRVRRLTIQTLGEMRSGAFATIPSLVELLSGEDDEEREEIIHALRSIGDPSAKVLGRLRGIMNDSQLDLRIAAAFALSQLDPSDTEGVKLLISVISDIKDRSVRKRTCRFLEQCGSRARSAIPALMELLKDESFHQIAFDTLRNLDPKGEKRVLAVLLSLLRSPDVAIRVHALSSIQELGPVAEPAVPGLLTIVKEDNDRIRIPALAALFAIRSHSRSVCRTCSALLDDPNLTVRLSAAAILLDGSPTHEESIRSLTEVYKHGSQLDRSRAIRVLADAAETGGPVSPVLIQALLEGDFGIRQRLFSTLSKLGRKAKGAVPALRRLLEREDLLDEYRQIRRIVRQIVGVGNLSSPNIHKLRLRR
jgi:HEAT repeat protein